MVAKNLDLRDNRTAMGAAVEEPIEALIRWWYFSIKYGKLHKCRISQIFKAEIDQK